MHFHSSLLLMKLRKLVPSRHAKNVHTGSLSSKEEAGTHCWLSLAQSSQPELAWSSRSPFE